MDNEMNEMNKPKKNDPVRRIIAWIGIVLLLALYVVTFVAAIASSPASHGLFLASLTLTLIVPPAIYVFQWLSKFGKKDK